MQKAMQWYRLPLETHDEENWTTYSQVPLWRGPVSIDIAALTETYYKWWPIHKRHLIAHPNRWAVGWFLWGFFRNWPCYNGTALYIPLLAWFLPTVYSKYMHIVLLWFVLLWAEWYHWMLHGDLQEIMIQVKSWKCACLVTWFCYHLIEKPGNKTGALSWPDPYNNITTNKKA